MIKYSDILNHIKNKNIELRHDVDVSLISAYNMSKFEEQNNVKSIYYLRFDCDYYNLISIDNIKIINFLLENHEIGCHVDVTNINNEHDLFNYLEYYNKIIPFKKFTFHINTYKTQSLGQVDNYINKSILYNEYISDSKNKFTNENFNKIKTLNDYTLVIHPEWWDNENFIFGLKSGEELLLDSLNTDKIYNKSLKEILNIW